MENRASKLPIQSIDDLKEMGKLIALSKMGGDLNPAMGFAIACICHQTGQSLNEFFETYHVLGGRLSMRADKMLANLLEAGGEFKIIARTPDRAAIFVKYGKAEGEFSITKQEALEEPFVYRGGPLAQMEELKKPLEKRALKDKYATPRSLMQMLWSRVVSDAVRSVCPKANQGYYTPEEVEDFTPVHGNAPSPRPQPIEPAETTNEVCPIPGKMLGRRWDAMDAKTLQYALDSKHPALTDAHLAIIRQTLKTKGEQQNG